MSTFGAHPGPAGNGPIADWRQIGVRVGKADVQLPQDECPLATRIPNRQLIVPYARLQYPILNDGLKTGFNHLLLVMLDLAKNAAYEATLCIAGENSVGPKRK